MQWDQGPSSTTSALSLCSNIALRASNSSCSTALSDRQLLDD
eukprot:CAMPEP_0173319384 /NCGR_PEP_ID=MMETSP1143-20121109/28195_1 /TAXON_ID=483371 /ORGANISM="non described non described, Strain CCMP2298" /LENGTH=41 /DNA_ID= /DNA_START= /DNA_END= /DNA_ORIENTATION=